MGHRNLLCTHQMIDPKSEQAVGYLHPNHLNQFGEVGDYPSQHMYPVQQRTGPDPRFAGHHGANFMYGAQQNMAQAQYYHPVANFGLGGAAPSNIYHPYMLGPSSSSSSVPLSNVSASLLPPSISVRHGVVIDESATADRLRRLCKRKDVEVVPGSFYHVPGTPNLCLPSANPSGTTEPLQWGQQFKYPMPFTQPENQGMLICPMTNGADRRLTSGSSSISLPPEAAFPHHQNTLAQRNYSGQPSNSAWLEQANHFVDGGCSDSNYVDQMAYMHGTSVNPANRESGYAMHHPPLPNFYQHLPPMQNMSINSYSHHSQTPLPSYSHPLNVHSNNLYPPRVDVASDSGFANSFQSISEQVNSALHDAAPEMLHGNFRLMSEGAAGSLQIPTFYGFEEITDHHRDMRLDIDDMSYEELLALEEHIGVVNTGLPEESILKNLKTSTRTTDTTCSRSDQSSEQVTENENCIVCQVEYEKNESIGTLECGHSFHADCIKEWLLVKNLCPICKKPAFATERSS